MTNIQKNNIKPLGFFALFASAVALLAGVGNSLFSGDYEYTVELAIIGAFAVPTWIKLFKYTTNNN